MMGIGELTALMKVHSEDRANFSHKNAQISVNFGQVLVLLENYLGISVSDVLLLSIY